MRVIILAAGLGIRLLPETGGTIPKCLIKVRGKTILDRQLQLLKQYGFNDIHIVVGGKGTCWNKTSLIEIKKRIKNVIINDINTETDSTYSLYLALAREKSKQVLALDGDLLFHQKVLEKLLNSKRKTAVVSRPARDPFEDGGKVELLDDVVLRIGRNIRPKTFPWNIYSGMVKIGEDLIDQLFRLLRREEYKKTNLVDPLCKLCETRLVFNVNVDTWINANTPELLYEANLFIENCDER